METTMYQPSFEHEPDDDRLPSFEHEPDEDRLPSFEHEPDEDTTAPVILSDAEPLW
jgi:hypothetical protein